MKEVLKQLPIYVQIQVNQKMGRELDQILGNIFNCLFHYFVKVYFNIKF